MSKLPTVTINGDVLSDFFFYFCHLSYRRMFRGTKEAAKAFSELMDRKVTVDELLQDFKERTDPTWMQWIELGKAPKPVSKD